MGAVKTSRKQNLQAAVCALILLWINIYVARDLFTSWSSHMGAMHGFWAGLAERANGSWFHATWWPYWEMGVPFEYTYAPMVPGLASLLAHLRGVSASMGFFSATGVIYIAGPLTLFFAAWRLTGRLGASFAGSLAYSLTSVSQVLVPDGNFSFRGFWVSRRLFIMTIWDDTPHAAALLFLPLVILFLARSIQTRRRVYYALTAAAIGATALSSAFGPVIVVMAAFCVLFVLRREDWRGNILLTIGLGAWGWAIAAPFLSPTLMARIREANAAAEDSWTAGSFTALAFTILGWVVLWHFLPRWTSDWRVQFFALFAWLASSIPIAEELMHDHFLPQPGRYIFEMELSLCLLAPFAVSPWLQRIPTRIRRAVLFLLIALAAEQVVAFRKNEKAYTFPVDVTKSVEYRAAMWAQQTFPQIRFFMPGSVAQWTNTFTDIQQFTGESFTMAVNQVQQRADTMIAFGSGESSDELRKTLAWLKAYGVGVIGVSGKGSEEFWKAFSHPEKFAGTLPVLWSSGGVTMYRVPLREFTLAHVVPESAIVRHVPRWPDDTSEVEKYTAGLDDSSLPGTAFDWDGRNRIRIRSTVVPGQVLTIQESFHPGWHATVGGKPQKLHADGLGMMWLRPDCNGGCEVELDYDGGWELRICRWLSWGAMIALFLVPWLKRGTTGTGVSVASSS